MFARSWTSSRVGSWMRSAPIPPAATAALSEPISVLAWPTIPSEPFATHTDPSSSSGRWRA
ncbi:DnaJ protein [Leifsonia xyli subsp. cynodontis DSM 46306]|uniref:Uncharacterized protein n=1 Tax=Leifsonia xyli subsp. cynodontis DSM 46306 TaxID=1389489 RepID=U3P9X2_LEIXC|nr:DnaJ protein [Leifsonia xyli subsp. cynodontis DSM 46306]